MKHSFHIFFLCMAAMLMLTACPKPEPEPEPKPVIPDVTVSLGTTTLVSLDALLDAAAVSRLEAGSDAYYVKGTGEPITLTLDPLDGFEPARPFTRYCNYPISHTFPLGKIPSIPASAPEVIDLMAYMPSSVNLGNRSKGMTIYFAALPTSALALDYIELTEDSHFDVTLSIVSPFFTEGTITPSFKVDMRKFFGSPEAEEGFLMFDVPLTAENGYTATQSFHLNNVAFDPENFNPEQHNLKVDAEIGLSGTVALEGLKTTKSRMASAPSTFQMTATVVLYDLACKSVTGRFAYEVKKVTETFVVSTLPSSVVLDPSRTSVLVDMSTDLSLEFEAQADLSAKHNRRKYADVSDIHFDMPVAAVGRTATGQCDLVQQADLSAFLSQRPDEVSLSIGAASKTEATGVVAVGETAFASFTPSVRFPLVFDETFTKTIKDTLSVESRVGQALKEKAVVLGGSVTNTLPMDVEMTVVLTDDTGRTLTREVQQVIAAESTVDLNLTLNATTSTTDALSQAHVTYQIHGVKNSRAFKPGNSLQADLTITIPGSK